MERVLTCSKCGEKIVVSRAQAGQEVKCGACGTQNQVPTLRGLANLPALSDSISPHSSATKVETWGWRGSLIAACLAGLLISAAYTGYKFYIWYQIDTSFTAEEHIAGNKDQIDKAGLDETLQIWDDYSTFSLGKRSPPIYKQYNDFSAESLRLAMIGGAMMVVLSLITVGTLRLAKTVK